MPPSGVLPQKQKSACPGVEIGQRQVSLLSSNSEQVWPLWIGSSSTTGSASEANDFKRICRNFCTPRGRLAHEASLLVLPARMTPLSRERLSRVILPITALRLTPISLAISRHDRPAAKWSFRASIRSVVQVCKTEGMGSLPGWILSGSRWPAREPNQPRLNPHSRFAIVTDGKQPVLDREPDAFFDQRPGDAGNAGAVGALSHEFLEIGNGRKRQSYWDAISLGFLGGHDKR